MLISQYGGESALIKLVQRQCKRGSDDLVLGIGDDAALIRPKPGMLTIVTTDLLAEGTHFRRDIIDPYSLGWKSVAVNISDIAAMGGTPTWTFISIALPDIEVEFVEELYRGMQDISCRFGSSIVGGDTNKITGQIVINVTQLGDVEESRAAIRSKAKPGDRVLVTGRIGESLAGLKILLQHGFEYAQEKHQYVLGRHIRPIPRVPEAGAAVGTGHVAAMMDLSDGLASDLGKMCEASGIGARIDIEKLPISVELIEAAADLDTDPDMLAAIGGEDYELLIAVSPEHSEALAKAVHDATGTPVSDIGEFTKTGERFIVYPNGSERRLEPGWEHF